MVSRLVANAGGSSPFPIALADATRLPFRNGLFGATLCVHVLHLIPQWEAAVDELLRVVRPGGVLLVDLGGPDDPVTRQVEDRFGATAGIVAERRPGLSRDRTPELDARLAAAGCGSRFLEPVPVTREAALAEHIDRLEQGHYSWTWGIEDDARRRAADDVRTWASAEIGPLDVPLRRSGEIRYRAYDVPDRRSG
jgi:SAM-dependent methyltransferase